MNFENIQMAIVRKRNDGSKINISQITEENRNDGYECIVCGSEVIPVAPNGKIITGENAKVTPHFKHLNTENCGQESFLHFWTKTELIKTGDKFKVITDKENEYIANQIFFEKSIDINGKKYIPDATIHTSCGNIIHFEFNHSNNKKIRDYIDRWKKLNQIIVEVSINSIMCVFEDSIPIFKALYYDGKCFNLNDEDKVYYEIIGKYKLTKFDEDILKIKEKEINRLDWLWDEIRKIKYESKDYDNIGNLVRSISSEEGRQIAINLLSRMSCGGSILHNYVAFLKDKIDRHLKHLNLKHNGYLIKYETEIPRLIYDRVFKGIMINFYVLDEDYPETYYTYNYDFKENILSDTLKQRIDRSVESLSRSNDLLLHILNVLKNNDKVIDYKLHYKNNTDYVDSIYIEDYRNKKFILFKSFYKDKMNEDELQDMFNNCINDEIIFLNLQNKFYDVDFFIIETNDSYNFSNNIPIVYKYDNLFNQTEMNLTYSNFIDKSFKFLPRYNFVEKMSELNVIRTQIHLLIKTYKFNDQDYLKVYKNFIEITEPDINKILKQLLYPIVFYSNNCEYNNLNIILNKDFTKDSDGNFRLWLIKDFIEILNYFNIITINNII